MIQEPCGRSCAWKIRPIQSVANINDEGETWKRVTQTTIIQILGNPTLRAAHYRGASATAFLGMLFQLTLSWSFLRDTSLQSLFFYYPSGHCYIVCPGTRRPRLTRSPSGPRFQSRARSFSGIAYRLFSPRSFSSSQHPIMLLSTSLSLPSESYRYLLLPRNP